MQGLEDSLLKPRVPRLNSVVQDASLKVIYCSGYNFERARQDYRLPREAIFLQKPCEPATLARTLRECLDFGAEKTA